MVYQNICSCGTSKRLLPNFFLFAQWHWGCLVLKFLSLFSKSLFMACQHSLIFPVIINSPPPPPLAMSNRHLPAPPAMPLFDPLPPPPPTNHQMQPTAIAGETSAIATANYVVRPHCSHRKEENVVVAVILAHGVLVIVIDCSPALMTMGPCPSFSWHNSN